jgi:Xaa-Pro aminopeptidase
VNVAYLCGFKSSNPALVVEQDRVRLFSDFRYADAARAIDGVEFVETKRALVADLAARLEGPVGFEAQSVSYADAETLRSQGLETIPRNGVVESLRAVKDEEELACLRRACAIADSVFTALPGEKFVGRTERALAWRIEELFHEHGGEGLAFEIIVGSGDNSARPHARATDREIGVGETVVVDAGCSIGGYFSDCTRTFATGALADDLEDAYSICLQAQEAALGGIRAGLTGVEADGLARRVVEDSPFAGMFGHGLGHGVGLDVHESPRMSTESGDTLAAGNVVTVEPGIYVPGRGGIRIEDDVVVTDDGIENMMHTGKELVTVD